MSDSVPIEETIIASLRQQLQHANDFISEFVASGVEHDAGGYKVMQVSTALLNDAMAWLEKQER